MDVKSVWMDVELGVDNVIVERLWKSVKYERVYLYAYDSVIEARKSITEYMDWYINSGLIQAWAEKP